MSNDAREQTGSNDQRRAMVMGAFAAAALVFPEKGKIHLQYTTTSPKLHKVLGVESPVFD